MAEPVVSIVLETVRDLLLEEARFLYGVGNDVKELEKQLKEMKCFLEDADKKRHGNKMVTDWISQIRDLAYRAESAVELHATRVSSRSRRGLGQLIRRYSCLSIHKLGSEILQITSDLGSVTEAMRAYGIKNIIDGGEGHTSSISGAGESSAASDNKNWLRKTFPDLEMDECFVGMEKEVNQLKYLLVEDKEHRVISVWGMGGSGKTTIARKLYNDIKHTKNGCFDCFVWVCISQQCQIRSVLEDILRQLRPPKVNENIVSDLPNVNENTVSTSLSDAALMEQVCEMQRRKRCLIVVDDLWETSHWNSLKHAFLVQDLQSKILLTTRERKVAEIGCPVELGRLSTENALKLLKNKAFPRTNIPDFALEENFEKIAKEMVKKCGYLPLAISLLGGILRMKNSIMEWELVNRDIKEHIYRDEKQIDEVLNLSYESLPYYLKPCFLYMGIFKEDQGVGVEYLYRMWIAQGMISNENIRDKDKILFEIAELYLGELASRSIVEVVINDGVTPGKKYKACKLHDVVREVCLKLGEMEDFGVLGLEYQSGKLSTLQREASSLMRIRHLGIYFSKEVQVEPDELTITCGEYSSKHLRSLQMASHINLSVAIEFPPQSIIDFQKFKLLRDLAIKGFKFAGRKLPRGITNLVHLRRLCLQACELDKVPWSISNLVYMDTFELTGSYNVEVPNVFKEMPRLKHLILSYWKVDYIGTYRLTLDEGVVELETLWGLDTRVHELKCMGRMKNLRRLSINFHDNESLLATIDAISTMDKLVSCMVGIKEGCELETNMGVLEKAFTCPNLDNVYISIKLGNMLAKCGCNFMSSKLTTLYLGGCAIEDDSMEILGKLPRLRDLSLLSGSFVGEKMTCPSNSFPRLKTLVLFKLPNLREWSVEAGAMPLLSKLEINECSNLEMIPDRLSDIYTLRELEISGMSELGKRVSASGEDFYKVSHVPLVIIRN